MSAKTLEQIKRGMALAFFACAYAEQADECGESLRGQIMDLIPSNIDPAAAHAAETLSMDMARANGIGVLVMFRIIERSDKTGADSECTPELFGHYCAMQAMGHGVGLESFGYAASDAITVPYCEFGSHSLERDYFDEGDAA